MTTINTSTFIDGKSLDEIYAVFKTAHSNVTRSLIEIRDLEDYADKVQYDMTEFIAIQNRFYENGLDAMRVAFHRIVGLNLFARMDFNENGERVFNFPREIADIPFDAVHESNSGEIWFTIGDNPYDDDELNANLMYDVADILMRYDFI